MISNKTDDPALGAEHQMLDVIDFLTWYPRFVKIDFFLRRQIMYERLRDYCIYKLKSCDIVTNLGIEELRFKKCFELIIFHV